MPAESITARAATEVMMVVVVVEVVVAAGVARSSTDLVEGHGHKRALGHRRGIGLQQSGGGGMARGRGAR